MKKTILQKTRILTVLCLLMAWIGIGNAWGQGGTSDFAGGDGLSAATPYLIETADQLNKVRNHLDKHFKLIDDIDLSSTLTGSR